MYGLRKPKYAVLGVELAGIVDAVGREATRFKPGDRVFGLSTRSFGAYAEYICLPEDGLLAKVPSGTSCDEAVGICDGAATSLVFLRDVARIRPGQRVLINGASGAVGIYAVQLAKHYGAEVTGVSSGANAELVRSNGADRVIDYAKIDFTRNGLCYDVIFDAVGKSSYPRCKSSLTPRGLYLGTVPTLGLMLSMARTSGSSGKKAIFSATGLKQTKENLDHLRELMEQGKLRAVIDRRYPLERASEAHAYVETGRKKGNVILQMIGE